MGICIPAGFMELYPQRFSSRNQSILTFSVKWTEESTRLAFIWETFHIYLGEKPASLYVKKTIGGRKEAYIGSRLWWAISS